MRKLLLAAVCALGLTGCTQTAVPVQNLPEITFQHLVPISLNVAKIELVDQSKSALGGKHVEHLFPTSPKKAISNWVRDRLVATGTSGLARVTILDASAVEEKLTKKSGVKGFFTNDQSEKYTANTSVKLDLFDGDSNLKGYTSAKASRYVTLAEDASLLDREKTWFEMIEDLMADFDKTMVGNMNTKLLR